MKAILILHNIAIDENVNDTLNELGVTCFTKFTNVLGRGELSEPHWNNDVWPGTNYGTFIVTEQAKAKEIVEKIRQMRGELGGEGIKAFVWEIEDIT
jgi:nitrogen regulatory protein PII